MAIADTIIAAVTKYQGGAAKIAGDVMKTFPGVSGDKVLKEFGQRRNGGVDGSPMGQEGMKVILPAASSLKWAFRKISDGTVTWYALMCWDTRGYFVPVPVSRLSERVTIYDEEQEPDEEGKRPTRPAFTNENNSDESPKDWKGPDQAASLENYLSVHGNKTLDLEKVNQYTGPSTDFSRDFARKVWDYTLTEDKAAYEASMLYLIENWNNIVTSLTEDDIKKVKKAIKDAGMDPETVLKVA